jgi:hypothetical protein
MPFGLSNAPATFQNMMNHIFRDLLDLGLIVYLDDILIYAETEEEHNHIITEVLKHLVANGLAISQDKCFGPLPELTFLVMSFRTMVSRWPKTKSNVFGIGNTQGV